MAVFQTTAQAIWLFLMLVAAVAKAGVLAYVSHLTNWAWTEYLFFYALTLATACILQGFVDPDGPLGLFTQAMIVIFFFPIVGLSFTVLVLVTVLFATSPEFLADVLLNRPAGLVFIGNDIYHFYTVLFAAAFYIMFHKVVHFSLNSVLVKYELMDNPLKLLIFLGFQAYSPLLLMALYASIFDFQVQYSTDISPVVGVVIAVLSLSVFGLLPLLAVLGLLGVGSRVPYSKEWLWRNDSAQALNGGVVVYEID